MAMPLSPASKPCTAQEITVIQAWRGGRNRTCDLKDDEPCELPTAPPHDVPVSPGRHLCATKLRLPLITSHGVPRWSLTTAGTVASFGLSPHHGQGNMIRVFD
jgi:hypothetical protein